MKKHFYLIALLVALFTTQVAVAETTSNPQVITDLLNRIGGSGAAERFETAINTDLNGERFIIGSLNGKPYIEGSNAIAVATGINWYLNHVAHINLTWNKLSTNLNAAELPLPAETIEKASAVDLRYYLNYCTYSYTCAMWTEERWMQEIDWMALHGINMPLMLVGLDCVWYDLYTKAEYGYNYTAEEISNYIAGPAFQAWWGMINCEGHGGPNPAWWYERSRALAKNMLARMRAYGMEPVLPGFCGEVPSSLKTKLSNDAEINTGGKWQGFNAPGLMGHKSTNWEKLAADFYDALENVMGTSKYYSMDPFHEGATGLTGTSSSDLTGYFQSCYAQMKKNVGEGVVWVAQNWDNNPRSAMLTGLNKGELLVLDLFAEANPHYRNGYSGHDYVYCMLLNFGGRVGLHGRFNNLVDGYYAALSARGDEMVGIGATPEGTEYNPMLYDMLFELPWRETAPDKADWVNNYTISRYGAENEGVQAAYEKLMATVYNCEGSQQGTFEPIICARPSLTADRVSSWSTAAVNYDTDIVIAAADGMLVEMNNFDSSNDNFNFDLLDVVRQALTNYALDFLKQLNSDYNAAGYDATFEARKNYYLTLIEDIDELLGTHKKFRLGHWAEMSRNIVTETAAAANGANAADADWLEYDNLRRQITTWANFHSALRDYSNREWNGLVKDYYLERWKIYFDALENGTAGTLNDTYWYNYGNAYVYDNTKTYTEEPEGDTKTVANEKFNKYFIKSTDGNGKTVYFQRHLEQSKTANEYVKYAYRGDDFTFEIPAGTTATMSIDANNDGLFGDGETVSSNTMTIPADAETTTVKALVVLSDNTEISFYIFVADNIEEARTVSVQAGDNGTVAIDGADGTSVTNTEYVTMIATGNSGYEFSHWVQVAGDGSETEASRDNPFVYLGKDAANFKAYFIQNIWGIPVEDRGDWDNATLASNQYLTSITCTQGENETEIYSADAATENFFVPVNTMINAAKGSRFTIDWQGDDNMKNCYLSAYIDLNKDGDFEDAGELLMVKGTFGKTDNSVIAGSLPILLPYDIPLGITHIRLRFDGAWKTNYNSTTKAFPASATLNRRCYEIVLNVTEYAAGTSHIVITSNNEEWGTVRNITGVPGVDIDVPSGTQICMEAFPNEGYQFVHWLDKYGRVAYTESQFYYIPTESGEFTAVFSHIVPQTVVIDGWEFGVRYEPGAMKTNKLANGVKPENGKTYYIYAPTRPTNDGDYVNRYLWNDKGTLTATDAAPTDDSYYWTCSVDGENYTFQNVGDPTKYLAYKAVAASPYNFKLGTGTTYYECITIYAVNDSIFIVINDKGGGFNQSTRAHNQSTEDHTTDFVFTEVSYPDNVILTEVRKSGNHDLVIPETVEILGEQCKIVGFDNNLFKDNKDLWSISLPSTIEEMSNNKVFSTSVKGENTPTDSGDNPDNKVQVIDLGFTLKNSEHWTIRATYKSDGVSTFNEFGTPLLYANGEGTGNELFYLSNINGWSSCWHVRSPFSGLGDNYFKDLTNTKISTFIAQIENTGNGTAIITVTNSVGQSQTSSEVTFSYDNISAFSAKLPKGLDITNFEVRKGAEPDPFEGCTNLLDITIADGGCQGGYTVDGREFKNASGVVLHTLADKEKEEELRALGELIDLTEALIEEVTVSVDPTGTATALPLTTTADSDFYVSTNADQNTGGQATDGGGIAALVDGRIEGNDHYFHSRWSGTAVNAPHHIQIDLGDGNSINTFKFSYVAHNAPDPTTIVVSGSNDGKNFTPIETITKDVIAVSSTYTSKVFESATAYRYLRFEVTASSRSGFGSGFGSYVCFGMKEFDLYKVTSSAEVAPLYKNLAGVTNEKTATVYDSLAEALYVYNNAGTAEEMQAAYNVLKPLYDVLNTKKDKVFNGVYHVKLGGQPLFVAYTETAVPNMSNDVAGYHLFDATTGNTSEANKELQNNAIAAKAQADALFTIVPNNDNTGYTISAQGLYLHSTRNAGWAPQLLSNDAAQAGVYLFEETTVDDVTVLKIKSNRNDIQYMNDWGAVIGNDKSNKANLSTFTLTQVAEYTLTVPANGVTTLCLPFNVVLPTGVTAYDLAEANLTNAGSYHTYKLVTVASEGETLAKNTPVIVKATAGDYDLTITMNDEDAKASTAGTLLHSGLVKTTIEAGSKYIYDGENFNRVTAATEIAANQCWMEPGESKGDIIYGTAPAYVLTTDEDNPVLYKIEIKRADDGSKVLQYDEASKQIAVADRADNKSYQAWYFTQGAADGQVFIHPYNADSNVIGATDTGNGAGKVSAARISGTRSLGRIGTTPSEFYYANIMHRWVLARHFATISCTERS